MVTTIGIYGGPKAQIACDEAVANMCGQMVARYNTHRNNFDANRKIANTAAGNMKTEAAQLGIDGCGSYKVPDTISW